jgi:predicted transcriptional regulator
MSAMKNIVLPILEEISTGAGTRMDLWKRCMIDDVSWEQFKRIFSSLLADKLIVRTWKTMRLGRADEFELTKEGKEIVQDFAI